MNSVGVGAGQEIHVNDIPKKPLWRRLAAFWPVLAVLAVLMASRSPFSASPGDPPASVAGVVFDLSFSPL